MKHLPNWIGWLKRHVCIKFGCGDKNHLQAKNETLHIFFCLWDSKLALAQGY